MRIPKKPSTDFANQWSKALANTGLPAASCKLLGRYISEIEARIATVEENLKELEDVVVDLAAKTGK